MPTRLIGLLCGGALLLSVPAVATAATSVDIRVEGASRTLVSGRTVSLTSAPVVKDGNPEHACPGASAAGALQRATNDWKATWYESPRGYLVDAIRGEDPPGTQFFAFWVNRKPAALGVCDVMLKDGDEVLFFPDRCDTFDPATQACADARLPLGIRVPASARRGRTITVSVVRYSTAGRAIAERAASVYANGRRVGRTDGAGRLRVRAAKVGRVSFYARKAGRVKSELDVTRIVRGS